MKLHFATLFATLLAFLAVVSAADDQINKDLISVDKKATSLKKALVKTDGTSLVSAIGIAYNALTLDRAITTSTKALKANASPMSDQGSTESLKTLTNTAGSVHVIVERLLAIHDNWQKLLVVMPFAQPIVSRSAKWTKDLSVALVNKMPEGSKADMQALAGRINGDLARAVVAYGGKVEQSQDGGVGGAEPQQGGGMGGAQPQQGGMGGAQPEQGGMGGMPAEGGQGPTRARKFGRSA